MEGRHTGQTRTRSCPCSVCPQCPHVAVNLTGAGRWRPNVDLRGVAFTVPFDPQVGGVAGQSRTYSLRSAMQGRCFSARAIPRGPSKLPVCQRPFGELRCRGKGFGFAPEWSLDYAVIVTNDKTHIVCFMYPPTVDEVVSRHIVLLSLPAEGSPFRLVSLGE